LLHYTREHEPDELPTAVLIKLAELLKNRRVELYEKNDINIKINQRVFNMK
jgi:hypothetical protein